MEDTGHKDAEEAILVLFTEIVLHVVMEDSDELPEGKMLPLNLKRLVLEQLMGSFYESNDS